MRCGVATAAVVIGYGPCWGAEVTWGDPFEIVTDADLELSYGPVRYAISGGDYDGPIEELQPPTQAYPTPPPSITVGSRVIPLQWTQVNTGPDSLFQSATFGEVTTFLPGDEKAINLSTDTEREAAVLGDFDDALFDSLTVRSDDQGGTVALSAANRIYNPAVIEPENGLTGNATLDSVLNSSVWADGRVFGFSTLVVELNALSIGKEYQVQIVANGDTRPPRGANIERNISAITVNDGTGPDGLSGNSSEELGVFRDLDGDGFRHVNSVIGTFAADDVSQTLNLVLANGRNPGFSLIVVSERAEPLPGDYNADGIVNAADYTVWRDNLGTDFGLLGNGDETGLSAGTVDEADYDLWVSSYGATGSSSASSQAVPEPGSVFIALAVVGAALAGNRRSDV